VEHPGAEPLASPLMAWVSTESTGSCARKIEDAGVPWVSRIRYRRLASLTRSGVDQIMSRAVR
jgi:hypothetical protein